MKNKTFKFISTPSHGFLIVPLGLVRMYINATNDNEHSLRDRLEYCYMNDKTASLEQDQAAGLFVEWYESYFKVKVICKESHQENIRKTYCLFHNKHLIIE
jgi:hypothetical protein